MIESGHKEFDVRRYQETGSGIVNMVEQVKLALADSQAMRQKLDSDYFEARKKAMELGGTPAEVRDRLNTFP